MPFNNLFLITILIITNLSAQYQDIWGGQSVATADNLDALSLNPAGLALHRGEQSGLYIPFSDNISIHSASRFDGFGYSLTYEYKDDLFPDVFNPADGNIAIGFELYRNTYAGAKWNKHHFVDFGLLYRPFNFASVGLVTQFDDEFKEHQQSTLGFALRPFLKHRLTLGIDAVLDYNESLNYFPHFSIQPVDGIVLSARADEKFKDFSLNLGFNFGKESVYSPSNYNKDGEYAGGIGFYSSSQKQSSIFNKKAKDTQRFIRLKLEGLFIEEPPLKPAFSFDFDINPFASKSPTGIQLRTWIEEIDKFTEDPEIDGLIIDMGGVRAGFAKRGEIYSALMRFKEAGKTIFVYSAKGISNADYYLISMADEIYLNEYTDVDLRGLRIEISFFRGLLDTLLIVPEVFRVNFDGKSYKTAADQFLNKRMSEEMRENYGDLMDDFYEIFLEGIAAGRGWERSQTEDVINNGPYFRPQDAIAAGLADSVMYPDQFDDYLKSLNDEKVEIVKWNEIDRAEDYVHEWAPEKKEKIAIIYAVGGIVSGKSNPGPAGSSIMGDETIVKAIKSAREDKDIKAIVFRIDSGGGSALASDQMWREVLKTTEEDSANVKPFIASMSDVAGSGGYYIACQADTIIAHPATVTGSIGVIGLRLNFSKLLNKIGITHDLIKKGDFSDFGSGTRLVSAEERVKIQASINDVYEKFKNRVIAGRDNFPEDGNLDDVAMGRIFSGDRAKDDIAISLVDVTGSFQDAIDLAKNAAGLEDSEVELVEYPKQEDGFKKLAKSFTKIRTPDYRDILPDKLSEQLEMLDILPVIMDDEIQMLIPFKITIY